MREPLITGIDVGEYSIKAVVIRPKKGRYTIKYYVELSAETSLYSVDFLFNHQEVVKKFQQLNKALPIFSSKVALSIPEQVVFDQIVPVESGSNTFEVQFAIQQALSLESSIPLENLSLDFVPIEDTNEEVSSTCDVHVYATYRQVIEDRVNVVKNAGFTPWLIQSENMALMQLLLFITDYWSNEASQYELNHSLLHIEQSSSVFCFVDATQMPHCKTIEFGVLQLNELGMDEFIKQLKIFIQPIIQVLLTSKTAIQSHQVWLSNDGVAERDNEEKIVSELKQVMPMNQAIKIDRLVLSDLFIGALDSNCLNGFAKTIGVAISGLVWKGEQ
ncbi:pilus assembly protein PilM [Vibrio sp. MA40-2]|uniref:pilus assembly protein PilM n=1 Tax=Vibrio sp. MA40-2 TaxID=3391828 RepID=UPI0039A5B371